MEKCILSSVNKARLQYVKILLVETVEFEEGRCCGHRLHGRSDMCILKSVVWKQKESEMYEGEECSVWTRKVWCVDEKSVVYGREKRSVETERKCDV